jgi:hypothetical protein
MSLPLVQTWCAGQVDAQLLGSEANEHSRTPVGFSGLLQSRSADAAFRLQVDGHFLVAVTATGFRNQDPG